MCRGVRPSESWREGGLENLKVHKSKLEMEKEAWLQVNPSFPCILMQDLGGHRVLKKTYCLLVRTSSSILREPCTFAEIVPPWFS